MQTSASMLINASKEQAWDVVTDIEKAQEFRDYTLISKCKTSSFLPKDS